MEITNESSDHSDTEDIKEVDSIFSSCEHIHSQSLGSKYILDISASSESNPYIAAALSDFDCGIFNLTESGVSKITQLKSHTNKLVGCKFCPGQNRLLYTASTDGTIKLWDLRVLKQSEVCSFKDTTLDQSNVVKSLCSFDVSPCNRLLAAGTDLIDSDVYILFWDVRNIKLLGAYWESHTDDITQIKFHPDNSNKLMSGSTDGLINIYNLLEQCEEDALEECLNTEELVEDLQWFNDGKQYKISCVTSANNLQLWYSDGAEPYKRFNRDEIALKIKKTTENTYIAKAHPVKDSLLVLCGSNGHEGRTLRSLNLSKDHMIPAFQFKENVQKIRSSHINENTGVLITGGEKGILDIWKPNFKVLNNK
ncbi:hypothetical protein ABEB36_002698 [Hypothenemus hampei]|uniref:WD repeat-containing protein 89 n=1 Tax=Hypothenemus hampei TaxID=57062 RepID=A0ABD1FAC5_HYPHA